MMVDEWTMLWRILIAAGLGLIIGLDRELHGRAAGLRTCLLVAMSGALLMSLSLHLSHLFAGPAEGSVVRLDPGGCPPTPSRAWAFWGPGPSSRAVCAPGGDHRRGHVGLHRHRPGRGGRSLRPRPGATAVTLVALKILRDIASHLSREQNVMLRLELDDPAAEDPVRELLKARKARILFAGRDRCLEAGTVVVRFSLSIRAGQAWREMLMEMEKIKGVSCYTWEQAEVP